jgi:hypothetical protein
MAIEINKSDSTVQAPSISVSGILITEGVKASASSTSNFTTVKVTTEVTDGVSSITNRDESIFFENVTVTITPDSTFTAETYGNVTPYNETATSTLSVEGKNIVTNSEVSSKSSTYFTLNGKDPSRTKATLYTGSFQIRRNASGTDNTVLKARTYVRGQSSPVMQVDLRIVRDVAQNTDESVITV